MPIKNKSKSPIKLIIFLCASLSFSLNALANNESDARIACDQAEETRQAATQAKMEWTTTAALIKEGKEAIQQGDFDQAIKYCAQAQFQAEASVKQAENEATAWKTRLPN